MAILHKFTIHLMLNWFPDCNRATYVNNKPTTRRLGEKNTKKVVWNSKILKNKSKERDGNFLAMFSSCMSILDDIIWSTDGWGKEILQRKSFLMVIVMIPADYLKPSGPEHFQVQRRLFFDPGSWDLWPLKCRCLCWSTLLTYCKRL